MSNTKQIKTNLQEKKSGELDTAIAAIKSIVKVKDMIVMVSVQSPEVSAVVEDVEGVYRDVVPLGAGVHIVISLGSLGGSLEAGIHEVG